MCIYEVSVLLLSVICCEELKSNAYDNMNMPCSLIYCFGTDTVLIVYNVVNMLKKKVQKY